MLNLFSRSSGRHYSNKFEYSSNGVCRRQSVTPSGRSIRRHTFEGAEAPPQSPPLSCHLQTSQPQFSPLLKTTDSCDLFGAKLDQLSSLLGLKRKGSLQPELFETWNRHRALTNELREIMSLVKHIKMVYEDTKGAYPPTRFKQLKGCVQRTQMFLQVCAVHSSLAKDLTAHHMRNGVEESELCFKRSIQRGSVIGSQAKEAEAFRQKEEAFHRMDLQQVMDDLNRLKEENATLTVQNKLLLGELQWLCDRYADLRRVNPISKYFHLKRIIRKIIYGDTLRDILVMKNLKHMET